MTRGEVSCCNIAPGQTQHPKPLSYTPHCYSLPNARQLPGNRQATAMQPPGNRQADPTTPTYSFLAEVMGQLSHDTLVPLPDYETHRVRESQRLLFYGCSAFEIGVRIKGLFCCLRHVKNSHLIYSEHHYFG